MFTPLTGSLFILSVIVTALFFRLAYSILGLVHLPGEKYTQKILTNQHQSLVRYKVIHTGLVLLYLIGLVGCVLVSLESTGNAKLTLAEVGTSTVVVLYIITYTRDLMRKKMVVLERLRVAWREESFTRLETDYFRGERQEALRETFSEFGVFPYDQLARYAEKLVAEEGERCILVHAWIIEKTNLVNEYKQFYQDSSYNECGSGCTA